MNFHSFLYLAFGIYFYIPACKGIASEGGTVVFIFFGSALTISYLHAGMIEFGMSKFTCKGESQYFINNIPNERFIKETFDSK